MNTTSKTKKQEQSKAAVNKAIDRLFHRFETSRETCNVTIQLTFNQGGLRNTRINFDHPDLLKPGLLIEDEDYDARL